AEAEPIELRLIPYYAWNNRGPGAMVTWIPTSAELLPRPGAGLAESIVAVEASHTWQGDAKAAVADGRLPEDSADTSIPRRTSWPQRGASQWVELRFDRERPIESVGVYWYDDQGGVRLPQAWSLEVERGGQWQPFERYVTDDYGLLPDQFN